MDEEVTMVRTAGEGDPEPRAKAPGVRRGVEIRSLGENTRRTQPRTGHCGHRGWDQPLEELTSVSQGPWSISPRNRTKEQSRGVGSMRKQRPNLCGETDEQRLPEAWGRPLHKSALGAKASLAAVPSGIGLPAPSPAVQPGASQQRSTSS